MLTKYHDTMTKRDPFGWLWKTPEGFNSVLFDDLFSGFKHLNSEILSNRIEETETEIVASFDLPGVKPSDIEINAVDQILTIEYTLRGKKHSREYTVRSDYDASSAIAKMEHGVLELRFPRLIRTKGKKIAIEVK